VRRARFWALIYALSVLALIHGMWRLADPPQLAGLFWLVLGGLGLKAAHDGQRWLGQG
jgi:hypothetical protein